MPPTLPEPRLSPPLSPADWPYARSVDTVRSPDRTCDVDIVIPVFNEERALAHSVERLHEHLTTSFPFSFRITVADNASTDGTWEVAAAIASDHPEVRAVRLDQKGRGRALQTVWLASDARVVAYMDVDLSTDLSAFLPLVAPLLSGHSDLAIGSRLSRSARVVRGTKRELISRSYNLILRATLKARFSDAQCGFKAMRADCARELLPLVQDGGWFFDTELLVLAQRAGLRIHEVPVDWIDDPDSRVDIVATALSDLRGVARLGRALVQGSLPLAEMRRQLGRGPLARPVPGVPPTLLRQALRFGGIGVASTVAYLLLYVWLRGPLGAQGANLSALLLTAVSNTAANRRLTFGVRGGGRRRPSPARRARHLRRWPGAHEWIPRRAARGQTGRAAARRARRARRRQRHGHRRALPALPCLGVPSRPPTPLTPPPTLRRPP